MWLREWQSEELKGLVFTVSFRGGEDVERRRIETLNPFHFTYLVCTDTNESHASRSLHAKDLQGSERLKRLGFRA